MLRGIFGSGGGAPVGGSGTSSPSTIPRWTGATTLGDSGLIDNGTAIYTTTRNVGIGTAAPSSALHVVGTGRFARTVNTSAAVFENTVGAGIYVTLSDSINSSAVGSNNGSLIFYNATNTTERARIDSSGNVILNTANTGATIQAAGTSQGLKLQGVSGTNNTDPNTLDFYADGGTANSGGVTWTPTVTFDGASTGITYATQVGRYTRVGNMVFATCYVVLTSKGSSTGNVKITGLPTSSNTTNLVTGATIGYFLNITSSGQVMGYMSPNDTGVILNQTTGAGVNTVLTDAAFANNSAFALTIAYPVT